MLRNSPTLCPSCMSASRVKSESLLNTVAPVTFAMKAHDVSASPLTMDSMSFHFERTRYSMTLGTMNGPTKDELPLEPDLVCHNRVESWSLSTPPGKFKGLGGGPRTLRRSSCDLDFSRRSRRVSLLECGRAPSKKIRSLWHSQRLQIQRDSVECLTSWHHMTLNLSRTRRQSN